MALKAVLIREDNHGYLSNRFDLEDPEDELPIGMYLVTDFGVEEHFAVLTEFNLTLNYERGADLDNGFFEIKRRA